MIVATVFNPTHFSQTIYLVLDLICSDFKISTVVPICIGSPLIEPVIPSVCTSTEPRIGGHL